MIEFICGLIVGGIIIGVLMRGDEGEVIHYHRPLQPEPSKDRLAVLRGERLVPPSTLRRGKAL